MKQIQVVEIDHNAINSFSRINGAYFRRIFKKGGSEVLGRTDTSPCYYMIDSKPAFRAFRGIF